MELEQEVATMREAAEKASVRLLATDPRDVKELVPAFTALAKAHSALGQLPVEDVLDAYACAAGGAANRQWAEIGT